MIAKAVEIGFAIGLVVLVASIPIALGLMFMRAGWRAGSAQSKKVGQNAND